MHHSLTFFLSALLCLTGIHSNAGLNTVQQIAPDDTTRTASFPALMLRENDKSHPIRLHTLHIDVKVVGNMATTTMEMIFENRENRILEGELYFPLGEGQTVSRFALDIDGKMREGVVVEKEKGRQVFEEVVRRNVDPGLLEWTQGNNFKARVYPIPAKGFKRMIVAYEQELDRLEQSCMYILPLNFKESIPDFSFRMEVFKQVLQPQNDPNSLINFQFEHWEDNYVAEYEKKDFQPGKYIGVGIPWEADEPKVYTERVPGSNSDYYYYVSLQPYALKSQEKIPATVRVIWDASSSASQRNLNAELSLLETYLRKIGNARIELSFLRNDLGKQESYTVSDGRCDALLKTLKETPFDGASAYRAIDFARFREDVILIFGDGLSNFGALDGTLPVKPVYCINSVSSANHSYLNYLASVSGGAYINLLNTEQQTALGMMGGSALRYTGNGMENSYPSLPLTIRNSVNVAGIIQGKTDAEFNFAYGDQVFTFRLAIDPEKQLTHTGMIRRIWAQKKLAELDMFPRENETAITSLGKEFGLVTRNTSLIVLDRVEDYVQHEITPPAELLSEYTALLTKKQADNTKEAEEHMATVKASFKAYVNWWKQSFDSIKVVSASDSVITGLNGNGNTITTGDGLYVVTTETVEEGRMTFRTVSSPEFSSERDAKEDKAEESNTSIQLAAWQPNAPYLDELKKLSGGERYSRYIGLKKEHGNTPSFYLDVSDLFIENNEKDLALRILSNIAELDLENHEMLRILAHRLEQLKYFDLALPVYTEVLRIRGEEPQSWRDLGLCHEKAGHYQEAVDKLYEVATRKWDSRFPDIEGIALIEVNHIVSLHRHKVSTQKIDPELLADLPVDVRIILNWDTDNCDMDLWVTDPYGEKCFYSHKETQTGGRMSNDFTGGYGPEQFTIKQGRPGNYTVQVNYYGSRSQKASGPTTIQMLLITNYGRPNEKVEEITRRLSENKEILDIGTLVFE